MSVDFRELKELQKRLEQAQKQVSKNMEQIIDEISDEFLQEVIDKTPNTNNNQLKNNWKKRVIDNSNGTFSVEIYNDLPYASNVEYGYRINGGKGWKDGKFMITITEQDIQRRMDKIAEKHFNKLLKGVFK